MNMKNQKDELDEEVAAILKLDIKVVETQRVPHSGDGAITFPNLDAKSQGCKLINTCVLYIDIRRSTELNLSHRPITVARLYSAFVRAMTRCARKYGGHVRGIIGDRIMVIFDCQDAYANAVNTAILMNSTAKYVIDKHFKANEVKCGIGIDAGRMLATKTGIRRHGAEQHNYRNLVWLGRPANVASKLTDLANKPEETFDAVLLNVAYSNGLMGSSIKREWPHSFVQNFRWDPARGLMVHNNPTFASFSSFTEKQVLRAETPAILMTEAVYNGFKRACPTDPCVVNGWFKSIAVKVPGYSGAVYGGGVIFKEFQ